MAARQPAKATTEGAVTGPVQIGPDPDASGVASALAHLTNDEPMTDEQRAFAEDREAAEQRAAALLSLAAVAETPLQLPSPTPRFTKPDYEPNGEVRHWQPGGDLYLVKSRMFAVALPDDRYVSASGGTVVELSKAAASRGVDLGQLVEYTAPTSG